MVSKSEIIVSVCICTYHRNQMLEKCLLSVLEQDFDQRMEVNVIDNDFKGTAGIVVFLLKEVFSEKGIQLNYYIEKNQGLSHARNRAIAESNGQFIAFIDDDEYAVKQWLKSLYHTLLEYNADGVWGPVLPEFEAGFPEWQKVLFQRRQMKTGTNISKLLLNSGNVLIKKEVIAKRDGPFDIALNQIGSEDTELFNYLTRKGAFFVWNNEAIAYELNGIDRSTVKWHVKRAYRGGWGFSMIQHKNLGLLKAFLLAFGWVIPAGVLHFFKSIRFFNRKTIFLSWKKIVAAQSGKIGYFFNLKVRSYTEKNAEIK